MKKINVGTLLFRSCQMRQILRFVLLITLLHFAKPHYGTLPNGMDTSNNFVQIESNMMSKLGEYFLQEQERLNQIKKHLNDWKVWRELNIDKEAEYIAIPQNLLHLFKRLTKDTDKLEKIMTIDRYNINAMDSTYIELPIENHLKQVILSLIDLQYQYDMKPEDIMNGSVIGVQFLNISLSTDSYCSIGKTCLEYNNHQCAIDWLSSCLSLSSDMMSRLKIIKLLYPSYIFLNQTDVAYQHALNYWNYDKYDTATEHTLLDLGSQLGSLKDEINDTFVTHRICRRDYKKVPTQNLRCRYNHENSAYLKIAPLKEEVLHDAPKILLYRDVLYDSEIEFIKSTSIQEMGPALLAGHESPTFTIRISETAFMDNELAALAALEQRTRDISNLSIDSSEFWQVVNYSPGGFYSIHSDYLPPDHVIVQLYGNRMTTMLFYINDVTQGGETVFPLIEVSATPTKGSVLIWHNVHADGSMNSWTHHSACPVIIGEKWVTTKWILSLKDRQCLRSIHENDLKMGYVSENLATNYTK